jgi:hypothetical protein
MAVSLPTDAALGASPRLERSKLAAGLWLAFWATLLIWTAHTLALAWPYVGLMPQWLLLVALPGVIFRSFDLLSMHAAKRRIGGWKRLLARMAALVLGVPAGIMGWDALDAISMHRFENAMSPLVARLHTTAPNSCPAQTRFALGPDVMAYLDGASAVRADAALHYDTRRFVLAFQGRSLDIDGSTLFYDSVARVWRKAHNDSLARSGELTKLVQGLAACRLRLE